MAFQVLVRFSNGTDVRCALLSGDTRSTLVKELGIRMTDKDYANYDFYFQHFVLDDDVELEHFEVKNGSVILAISQTLVGSDFPHNVVLTTRSLAYKQSPTHTVPVYLKIHWQPSGYFLMIETDLEESIFQIQKKVQEIMHDFKTKVEALVGETARNQEETVKQVGLMSGNTLVFKRSGS
jgi:hypothetical protein